MAGRRHLRPVPRKERRVREAARGGGHRLRTRGAEGRGVPGGVPDRAGERARLGAALSRTLTPAPLSHQEFGATATLEIPQSAPDPAAALPHCVLLYLTPDQ